MAQSTGRHRLTVLLVICAVVRLFVGCIGLDSLREDRDDYGRLAVTFAATGTFGYPEAGGLMHPTAYRPILYPWILSWFAGRDGLFLPAVMLCHVILALVTIAGVDRIAQRHLGRWSWMPAVAVALDPILLRHQQLVMTETLAAALAVVVWELTEDALKASGNTITSRRRTALRYFVVGLVLGVSALARPTALPWALLIMLLAMMRTIEWPQKLTNASAVLLGISCLLLPWGVRNAQQVDRFTVTTTHGGYTLLLANNPSIYDHFREQGFSRAWDAESFHQHWADRRSGDPRDPKFWKSELSEPNGAPQIDELADDQLAGEAAMATINREPWMFLESCVIRISWLWAVAPEPLTSNDAEESQRSKAVRWSIGIWYSLWFIAATVGLLRMLRRRALQQWTVPLALVLSLTAVHAVYWSNMRMRAPLMPVVYVIGSYGILSSVSRRRAGRELDASQPANAVV
ncbi:MAG: hypothetical protein U0892_14990 [Pirellulales bacterium]